MLQEKMKRGYTFEDPIDFERALVLVPTRPSAVAVEKWLLKEREAVDGVWVTTPLELTETLFEFYLTRSDIKQCPSKFNYLAILLEVLKNKENSVPFSIWAHKNGYRKLLLSFFSDLDKSLLNTDLLNDLLFKSCNETTRSAFQLYKDFDELRTKRHISKEVDSNIDIISAIPDLINSKGLKGGTFLLIPSYDWSALQISIIREIEKVMGNFKQLNYMLSCNNLIVSFRRIFDNDCFYDLIPVENNIINNKDILKQSISLFGTLPTERHIEEESPIPLKAPFRIISAENPLNEVKEALEIIKDWLGEGLNPEDIAVVSRTISPYGEIFYRYGSVDNNHIVGGRLLPEMPCLSSGVHQIIPLLESVVHEGITLKSVKNLLLHPSLKIEKRRDVIEILNELIKNHFFEGTIGNWLPIIKDALSRKIFSNPDKYYYYFPQKQLPNTESMIEFVINFASELNNLASAKFMVPFLSILKELFDKYAKNEDSPSFPAELPDIKFCNPMDGFAILRAIAEDLPIKPESVEGIVPFYEAMEGRGLLAKRIIILGFNEGIFPLLRNDEYILSEMDRLSIERKIMNKNVLEFPSSILPKRYDMEERLILISVLSNISDEIVITYSRQDMVGKPLLPSRFLKDLCSCFIRSILGDKNGNNIIERLYKTTDESLSSFWKEPENGINNIIDFKIEGIHNDINVNETDKYAPVLSYYGWNEASYLDSYRDNPINIFDNIWSPTRLKNIIICPYRYLLEYIYKLSGDEEENLENLMKGSALHRFYNYLFADFKGRVISVSSKDDWNNYFERKLKDFMKEESDNVGKLSNNLQWRIFFHNIIEECKYFSGLEFERIKCNTIKLINLESEFGFNDGIAVHIKGIEKPILLKGRIDRIEEENGLLNVIDYKTGKYHSALDLKREMELQGLLYPLLLRDNKKGITPRGLYYFCTSRSSKRKNKFVENIISEEELAFILVSLNSIVSMGLFPPLPQKAGYKDGDTCSTCRVRSFCQAPDRIGSIEALKRDPQFSDFLIARSQLTGKSNE